MCTFDSEGDVRQIHKYSVNVYHCVTLRFHNLSLVKLAFMSPNVHLQLYGDVQEYTFSNVSLADGETYFAKVIACNGARLCTTSVSEGILVGQLFTIFLHMSSCLSV